MIGHELGHMQQAASVGSTSVAYPFFDPAGGPTPARPTACACDSVVSSNRYHCLNSREYSSPAQSEGWAHFFSAKVMNNPTATSWNFGYYKEVRTDTVFVRTPPVAIDSKAPVKYRNRNCPLVEVGTEWDWLTFLTNVHTTGTNKLSMTELADVYQRACGVSGTACSGGEISWDTTTPQISPGNDAGVGAINRKPLRPAAQAKFGLGSAKYNQWLNTGDANGVSNNLAP